MLQPTHEQSLAIERGLAAQNLMTSDVFTAVISTLLQQYLSTLIATTPEQEQKRTACYYSTKGLQDIEETLNEWVTVKDEIAASLNDTEDDSDIDLETF